jgi:hypothetical protein
MMGSIAASAGCPRMTERGTSARRLARHAPALSAAAAACIPVEFPLKTVKSRAYLPLPLHPATGYLMPSAAGAFRSSLV